MKKRKSTCMCEPPKIDLVGACMNLQYRFSGRDKLFYKHGSNIVYDEHGSVIGTFTEEDGMYEIHPTKA